MTENKKPAKKPAAKKAAPKTKKAAPPQKKVNVLGGRSFVLAGKFEDGVAAGGECKLFSAGTVDEAVADAVADGWAGDELSVVYVDARRLSVSTAVTFSEA